MRSTVLALTVITSILLLGCGQQIKSIPRAVIEQTQSKVQIPPTSDIQSISIASDGAGQMTMAPEKPTATLVQVLTWLKNAKPVSVQFPKPKVTHQGSSGGYTGPASLMLSLKDKENIIITPSFYVWSNSNGGYDDHYLTGIVQYQTSNQTFYLDSLPLYKWLKDDRWKSDFKLATG